MAKITDLIAKCDESEIFIQNIDENLLAANIRRKNGAITFSTNQNFVTERLSGKPSKIGFVIWLPSDVFER